MAIENKTIPTKFKRKKGTGGLTNYGYRRITVNGERVLEHRYIMETLINRKLEPYEKVHHKDKVRTNNSIANLELLSSHSEHMKKHHGREYLVDWGAISVPYYGHGSRKPRTICLIEGCPTWQRSRGLCGKHSVSFFKWQKEHR